MILKQSFCKANANPDGLNLRCKSCQSKWTKEYTNTEKGRIQALVNSSKSHTIKHKKKQHRSNMCESEVSVEFLHKMYKNQEKKCYYSDIPLSIITESDWLISLERLNPSIGYKNNNVVLICSELNHMLQWTKNKIIKVIKLSGKKSSINDAHLEEALIQPSVGAPGKKRRLKRKTTIINEEQYLQCPQCQVFLFKKDFSSGSSICRQCGNDAPQKIKTIRAFLGKLLSHARARNIGFDLTIEWAIKQLISQKKQCFYSKIPFVFTPCEDWRCSIERLDQSKGYLQSNTVFIFWEFNTAITQWNKSKFQYFLNHIKEKYKNKVI